MPRPALLLTTSDAPSEEALRVVGAGLDEYNLAVAPLNDVRPLAAFASQPSGEVVGGAVGRTWGRCCELLELWVAQDYRGEGVGSQLLAEFESEARQRGCSVFYLTTLSYQAPEFYQERGYRVLAQIAGYPNGIVKYLMHKAEV
jgi:GNAT superfamily N-acetyltransferase